MITKMIKKIYILLAVSWVATSCNYLDVTPTGKVIPEKVSEFRALLTSAYTIKPIHKILLAVRSDEVFPYNYDGGVYDTYIDIATCNDGVTSGKTYPWQSMYKMIFYANSVIADVMEATSDTREDSKEQIMAEALLLRAYTHFELLNLYAKPYSAATANTDRGIPLSVRIDVEQEYVPASVGEVYAQIFADLEEGQRLLQVDKQTQAYRYRFSRMSAKALEARIRLYRSEWELALSAAEELLPECELENLNDANAKSPYYYDSKESIQALERVTNIDIVADMYMQENIMGKYHKEKDQRVGRYFRNMGGGEYVPNKCNGDDMKVTFRSAEIYLIAAEAAAHIDGKLSVSKQYLKQLTENRLTPDYYAERAVETDAMNQENLLVEIADERARELALEGHRWYDLRRTNRPEIVKTYLDKNYEEQTFRLLQDDPRYTIRFPKEATENNPNLNN